jgi:hypothetical protein
VVGFVRSDDVLPVLISQATLAKRQNLDNKECRLVVSNDFVGMTFPRLVKSYEEATGIIASVASRTGVLYVNGFDAVPPDLVHLKDTVHFWDPGAERLAKAIAKALVDDPGFNGLVDGIHLAKKPLNTR